MALYPSARSVVLLDKRFGGELTLADLIGVSAVTQQLSKKSGLTGGGSTTGGMGTTHGGGGAAAAERSGKSVGAGERSAGDLSRGANGYGYIRGYTLPLSPLAALCLCFRVSCFQSVPRSPPPSDSRPTPTPYPTHHLLTTHYPPTGSGGASMLSVSEIAAAAAAALLPQGPAQRKRSWTDDLENLEYLQIRNERRILRMRRDFLKEAQDALGETAEGKAWKKEEWAKWNPPRRAPPCYPPSYPSRVATHTSLGCKPRSLPTPTHPLPAPTHAGGTAPSPPRATPYQKAGSGRTPRAPARRTSRPSSPSLPRDPSSGRGKRPCPSGESWRRWA